jgi:hypothetical protein
MSNNTSPNPSESDISMQKLLRLRRYEQPPAGYYDEFLREFHHRQRAELLKPSLTTLLLERFSSWASEFRVPAFAYAGATAVAVIASVSIWNTSSPTPSQPSYAVSYSQSSPFSQTPVTIQKMQPVSLRVNTSAAEDSSQVFPTSYLLQARPASHESPLSF